MTDAPLLVERTGSIVRLTLHRPDVGNAIDMAMARALLDVAIVCDTDPSVRCVVLTGAGRMFCVGGDISDFASAGDSRSAFLSELATTLHAAVTKLARMSKPLLVLANGPAAGAGLSLVLLGDLVLAAASAHFTAAYTAIGLTPDGGMTWLLPRLVGLRRAQEMILTNRRISAGEAALVGIATRVVSDADLAAEGETMAVSLARSAVEALGSSRRLLNGSYATGLETQMELEARSIAAAGMGRESQEGIAAFAAKRQPQFEE
jgi:2-(1,2-epoxy-1,2-dihydrophenyl)acetyl-CoA isomerase